MSKVKIGDKFGDLTVISNAGGEHWLCKCVCGGEKEVPTYKLTGGEVKSCGCLHRRKISKDITGKRFNHLVAICLDHFDKEGRSHWKFRCDCGNEIVYEMRKVTVHKKESCGCELHKYKIGHRFGKLVITKYIGNGMYKCKCDCGGEKIASSSNLARGNVLSCGCIKKGVCAKDYSNIRFGNLIPFEYVGNSDWLCKCDCGNIKKVHSSDFVYGKTTSCGCKNVAKTGSAPELEIKDFIEDLTGKKFTKSKVLDGKEIDLYCEELKLGIEYNGSPYHATENGLYRNVDKYYHRDKFLLAKSIGINLITIFDRDYEENRDNVFEKLRELFDVPQNDIEYTDNRWGNGSWMKKYGYIENGQEDPESFCYQNKYIVYDCGKTRWIRIYTMGV